MGDLPGNVTVNFSHTATALARGCGQRLSDFPEGRYRFDSTEGLDPHLRLDDSAEGCVCAGHFFCFPPSTTLTATLLLQVDFYQPAAVLIIFLRRCQCRLKLAV
ncbi:hypothetical protein NPIL_585031 [Nephila pilipes]|uniref:Uncharacterized protein n=1 Tax=Nephila pilipes TaxID=299642 RepID=A0A8X6UKK6_NEPPI|nr:hypothetical protein NPIL_585031 [Nephila pilipes]